MKCIAYLTTMALWSKQNFEFFCETKKVLKCNDLT